MIGLTRFSLKRPVTLILAVITVLFFGLRSVMNAPMELNPEMSLPMMVVSTVYPGASPADIDELVSKKIEAEVSTLNGIKTVSVSSMENASTMLLQYEFGTNMDKAYINLKKVLDSVKSSLPKDAEEPNIIEIDMNAQSDIQLSIAGGTDGNLQDYVNTNIVPEFKKMSSVGSVSISGGQSSYIRIELIPEKLAQYNLAMSDIGNIISSADFSTPVGKVDYGRQSLSVSIGADYKDINRLKDIVIPLKTGDVIHLSDVANVYDALEEKNSLSRYNGEEVVSVAITKQQSSTSVEVSKQVNKVIEELKANNKDLTITTIFDSSKYIKESISDVFKTLIMAVILSMIVLFIFFNAKRRQRIIPIIPPKKNKSVEFVKSIGNLYLNEGESRDMMVKKAQYFLHRVRMELLIDTQKLDEEFINKLHLKTGKSIEKITEAVDFIKKSQQSQFILSNRDLIKMNRILDEIY